MWEKIYYPWHENQWIELNLKFIVLIGYVRISNRNLFKMWHLNDE